MPVLTQLKRYSLWLRIPLALIAVLLIGLTFKVMTTLSRPSQFVNAYKVVLNGPGKTIHIYKLPVLGFSHYLYLAGSILPASQDEKQTRLFQHQGPDTPALAPAFLTDESGAVEILSPQVPFLSQPEETFLYNQPLHMVGWRRSNTGLSLFALAHSRQELLDLLNQRSGYWQTVLFNQGLLLAALVFIIFWLLNLSLLSNPNLQTIQLLIVNLIFLVLFYSVVALSAYPLGTTILPILKILALSNAVFIPLAWLINRRRAPQSA